MRGIVSIGVLERIEEILRERSFALGWSGGFGKHPKIWVHSSSQMHALQAKFDGKTFEKN